MAVEETCLWQSGGYLHLRVNPGDDYYERKMLRFGAAVLFAPLRDTETELCFDVSLLETLEEGIRRDPSPSHVVRMMHQLLLGIELLQDYYLEETQVFQDPRFIYWNEQQGRIKWVFLPEGESFDCFRNAGFDSLLGFVADLLMKLRLEEGIHAGQVKEEAMELDFFALETARILKGDGSQGNGPAPLERLRMLDKRWDT